MTIPNHVMRSLIRDRMEDEVAALQVEADEAREKALAAYAPPVLDIIDLDECEAEISKYRAELVAVDDLLDAQRTTRYAWEKYATALRAHLTDLHDRHRALEHG